MPDEHVYADDAVSGAEVKRLLGRRRMLDAIEAGAPFQAIVMRDTSRFSRRDGDEAVGELKCIVRRDSCALASSGARRGVPEDRCGTPPLSAACLRTVREAG